MSWGSGKGVDGAAWLRVSAGSVLDFVAEADLPSLSQPIASRFAYEE